MNNAKLMLFALAIGKFKTNTFALTIELALALLHQYDII
jgi:hypothetical protein